MLNWRWAVLLAVIIVTAVILLQSRLGSGSKLADASGLPLVEVRVPELTGVAESGEQTYNEFCAACHGVNGAGQDGIAPPLVHVIYEPNHHGDGSFYLAAARGVRAHHWPFGDMPPVADISDEEVGRIIAYIRTLQRANGIQ